jgi:hypothetical protein
MSKFVTKNKVLKKDWQKSGNIKFINGDRTHIWREFIRLHKNDIDAPL